MKGSKKDNITNILCPTDTQPSESTNSFRPKALGSGQSVAGGKKGSHGLQFKAEVDLIDGPFLDMVFRGRATNGAEPTTYEGNFFIEQERVRGVGHHYVGRKNFRAKKRIPGGWHQNITDPQKPTNHAAYNRHEALPDFAPTDFQDFTRKVAAMWKIDLGWEGSLL